MIAIQTGARHYFAIKVRTLWWKKWCWVSELTTNDKCSPASLRRIAVEIIRPNRLKCMAKLLRKAKRKASRACEKINKTEAFAGFQKSAELPLGIYAFGVKGRFLWGVKKLLTHDKIL